MPNLIESLKAWRPRNTIHTALYASWSLASILFALYAINDWQNNSKQLQHQLNNMAFLVSKNTQQQAESLYFQLSLLNKKVTSAHATTPNAAPNLNQIKRIGYDHSLLLDQQGKIITSTFKSTKNYQLDLTNTLLTPTTVQEIISNKQPAFAPTFSLGVANSNQYVPICQPIQLQEQSILCLAISTGSEVLNWHSFNAKNNTSIQVISGGSHLLYSDPLLMHRRSLLGMPIADGTMNDELELVKQQEEKIKVFNNYSGLDRIKRLGSIHYLPSQDLFIVISMSETKAALAWLTSTIIPTIMLILFFLSSYALAQFSIKASARAVATRKITAITIQEQKNTLQLLFSNLPGIIYRVRIPDYKVLFITEGCNELLGYSSSVYLSGQRTPFDDIHPEDQDILVKHANSITSQQPTYEHIFRINNPSGEMKWVMDRGRAIKEKGEQEYLEGILLDITEHMHSQQQIEYLATRDPLTELANRYLFNDELVNHIDTFRDDTSIALLFIDLDRFKTINDSLGHQVGDRLLKLVAHRLQECISDDILLARLGGDEFMIMMKNPPSMDSVEALAHSINISISKVYELDYYKLNTSCSIGISMYPQDSTESHILLRNADTAMYSAKAKGGNRYQFYTNEMNQKVNSRLTIETELRRAIKENEFEVHYQPQVNAHSGELEGAEALVRWIHPTAGMISPIEFIPVAEETGLIRDIGDWVLNEACQTFSHWNHESGLNLSVAVNVSVTQLNDSFVLRVQEILNQTNFSTENLELEITESLLMDNVQENIRILENINRQGIRFAMDDFGTGYSSLSYLRQFPISKLKIDRSFVNDITDDSDDEAIIRAIIAMGQTLKLKVIAEGVENHQQLVLLQTMGCDSYQGYYFSKPLPPNDFYKKYIEPTGNTLQSTQVL